MELFSAQKPEDELLCDECHEPVQSVVIVGNLLTKVFVCRDCLLLGARTIKEAEALQTEQA